MKFEDRMMLYQPARRLTMIEVICFSCLEKTPVAEIENLCHSETELFGAQS
ncbi:MAG: hypothetical protein ACE5NG_08065 [bacterium]